MARAAETPAAVRTKLGEVVDPKSPNASAFQPLLDSLGEAISGPPGTYTVSPQQLAGVNANLPDGALRGLQATDGRLVATVEDPFLGVVEVPMPIPLEVTPVAVARRRGCSADGCGAVRCEPG